ncbi:MAG: DNA polymerase III subunit delta [Candidatus Omnitrophica bacterium]|nr:DNA polymerase III subunit delta [Candidatus Omnitrophota bacterium]
MTSNFLIIGNDEYIRQSELDKIKNKFLALSESELNYSSHGPDDVDGIMDSLGTMPFLAEKRVVHIKKAEDLAEDFIETLSSYLENPTESSVLILTAEASFKKTKGYHKLSKLLEEVRADKPKPVKLKGWIRSFYSKEGIDISPRAVDLIIELKGDDTQSIKMELEKLAAFSGGERIEALHVEELVGRSVTETVFKIGDAINAGNSGRVFKVLNDLYDQKKQPPEIIGYLGWYIRVVQKISLLLGKGIGFDGIAGELGYSPAYTRRLTSQAKKYPSSQIKRWVKLLLEADRNIKTGRTEAKLALETLLVGLLKTTES